MFIAARRLINTILARKKCGFWNIRSLLNLINFLKPLLHNSTAQVPKIACQTYCSVKIIRIVCSIQQSVLLHQFCVVQSQKHVSWPLNLTKFDRNISANGLKFPVKILPHPPEWQTKAGEKLSESAFYCSASIGKTGSFRSVCVFKMLPTVHIYERSGNWDDP